MDDELYKRLYGNYWSNGYPSWEMLPQPDPIKHPTNDGGCVGWSRELQAWQYYPPRPKRTPRRYHPSSMAHRLYSRRRVAIASRQ